MEFQTPADIGNRALQHCGASRMDTVLGFNENSRNASEVQFVYGKLREAELQRSDWKFAIKRTVLRAVDSTTMLLVPALFSPTVSYFAGSIVSDQNNNLWSSLIGNNIGNQPETTPYWEPYFGSMTVPAYATSTSYFAGELVYTAPGDGTNRVYRSLQNGNSDVPGTATAYSSTTTYFKNQVVTYLSVAYMSLIDLNTGQTPNLAPALWAAGTTYAAGNKVGGSDGVIYSSIGSGNIGNNPVSDGGIHWTNTGVLNPWTTVFVGGSGSDKWLQIGGTEFPQGVSLTSLNIIYPLGTGPYSQDTSRNVYRLPFGFMRKVNQNPGFNGITWLGGPSGIIDDDWAFENNYLITTYAGPIPLRFVANVTDVTLMDPMFCEGLAARIAIEICDVITQSGTKLQNIASAYKKFMDEARARNSIEQGAEEPPEDTFISVRL